MRQTFDSWMAKVDAHVGRRLLGLSYRDLPDCSYREWYEDGVSPSEAARMAISEA